MRAVIARTLAGALALATFSARAPAQQVAPIPGAVGVDSTNGCLLCHAAQRTAASEGVHAQHGVQCVSCHGGDASARSLPAAHQGGFTGTLSKVQVAELCGSCHSNPNRMRAFGLPTGQLEQFRTSKHGQLLFGSHNTDAPTCTNCHGTHIIYPPYDARSQVYPTNIPSTCAHCHADDKLMAKYKLRTDQLDHFTNSAHGVGLFQKQNFASPTCISCHGAHSALPPSGREVASVCGRCHALVDQAFSAGPHGKAAAGGKLRGCLACHANHSTEAVPIEKIGETCDNCHADDTRLHQFGVDLQHSVVQAGEDMRSAKAAVDQLARNGEQVGYYEVRYQEAQTYYLQIAQAQHSLNLERVNDLGRRVRSLSVSLNDAANTSQENRWEHKLILLPVWFLSLSAIVLAWLALRAVRKSRDEPPEG